MGLFDSIFGSDSTDGAVVEAVKENNKVRPITEQNEIVKDVNADITIELSGRWGNSVYSANFIDVEDGMKLYLSWNSTPHGISNRKTTLLDLKTMQILFLNPFTNYVPSYKMKKNR